MNDTTIYHIKKQTIYLILFLLFFTTLSLTSYFNKEYSHILGVCHLISIGYLIYLVLSLRKVVKEKFSLFLLFLTISCSITFIYLIFNLFYPINPLNEPDFRLTSDTIEGFIPHSIFRYSEGTMLFISFVTMLVMNASASARKDFIFTGIIILSTIFSLAITVVNLILESSYSEHFRLFHLSLLFNVVYVSIVSLFIYPDLMKRVLVWGQIFRMYFVCCLAFVLCNGTLVFLMAFDFFQIDIQIIDSIRFLFLAFLLYGIILHVSKNTSIQPLENPHLNRTFISYFVIIIALSTVIEIFTETIPIYFYISNAITIIALGVRLLFIKRLDEHANEQLKRIAHIDELTNLENQKKLFSDIQSFIIKQLPFTVILVNISRFKQINNLLTYEVGNTILITFVERLRTAIKGIAPTSRIYRHSGDEFMIVTHLENKNDLTALCKHIFDSLIEPFQVKNERIKVFPIIGITTYPDDASTMDGLLKNLNTALKEAKLLPIQKYIFYSKEMGIDLEEKLEIEKDLYSGLENGEFELFYQPQYSPHHEFAGFEALLRWNHPTKGCIPPMKFIPVAEETGFIVLLGEWILSEACRQLVQWSDLYDALAKISVNVSVRQLQQADFVSRVNEIIQKFNIPAHQIMLEITETYPFYKDPDLVERISELRKIGCKISIDDFGTGFCSLTSLTIVEIDQIKIAREYIQTIGTNSKEEILLKHLFIMLDSLSFSIVAEGVETIEQLHELQATKCDYIQGFYFSKPLNQVEATKVFQESVMTGNFVL